LIVALVLGGLLPTAFADDATDKSFEALAKYDWGQDRNVLKAIDDAVVASHDNAAAKKALEKRLAAVLKTDAPQAAKDYVCRKLSLIGSADSVPALAALLTDEKLSHMGRYGLERIPSPDAVKALRDAVAKTKGLQKIGVINSLGVRRDADSVSALTALLNDSDKEIVAAAAAALGAIGSTDASKALLDFDKDAPKSLSLAAADACLVCAEHLLADGKKAEATQVYRALAVGDRPKHVKLAATRGMLATKK
jgi:HEAT repeat protein